MNELPGALLTTMGRLAVTFGVAAAAGLALGTVLSRSPRATAFVAPVALGLRALPSVCLLPMATLWFGKNEGTLLGATAVSPVFVIAMAAERALLSIPGSWAQVGAAMDAKGWTLYLRVLLPAAFPVLLAGLRVGWTLTWWSLIAAEMLFADRGMGYRLQAAWGAGDAGGVAAWSAVILAVGLAMDRLVFGLCERAVRRRWGQQQAS
jgi:NitT/TauT family transport system permease protein